MPELQTFGRRFLTYRGEFAQGNTARHAAADIIDRWRSIAINPAIGDDQIIEVVDMQNIANLQAFPAKTHIGQRRRQTNDGQATAR